jgi:hypothetical protein
MPQNFVIRFVSVLAFVLVIAALSIHFLFSGETTVVLYMDLTYYSCRAYFNIGVFG